MSSVKTAKPIYTTEVRTGAALGAWGGQVVTDEGTEWHSTRGFRGAADAVSGSERVLSV